MIYEMRVYDCLPGRLPALLRRFADHTLAAVGQARHPPSRVSSRRWSVKATSA